MKKGRLGTMTHDCKRHGTTTLFAALNVLDGNLIGKNMQRYRHQEFIHFLNAIDPNCRPALPAFGASSTRCQQLLETGIPLRHAGRAVD